MLSDADVDYIRQLEKRIVYLEGRVSLLEAGYKPADPVLHVKKELEKKKDEKQYDPITQYGLDL